MSYQVIWSEKSKKNLSTLDKNVSERIVSKVEDIKEDPFAFVKRLQGMKLYSLRVGDYRVILDIENKKMVIFVVKIGHRGKVYDDL
jgi:mRNA interferase RelE/StbE